jgi:peptidoglycan/xylan/chitin deacetylase (PgdA/CDA1 family)
MIENHPIRFLLALLTLFGAVRAIGAAETADTTRPQIILLKLDDVVAYRPGREPVPPRWQRITDYLLANKIHASFGIICDSLEKDNPAYFKWIKDLHEQGTIEFWLHGYYSRKGEDKIGEFEQGTAEEQRAVLEKSERLAKDRLGFPLAAFGPHWSGTTDATDEALEGVPEIRIWLYGPKQPKYFSRLSLERVMALENPTFVPDFGRFRDMYERVGGRREVLVLQGHPNQWDDKRWEGFVAIIEYLRAHRCVFMTPSEYARQLSAR